MGSPYMPQHGFDTWVPDEHGHTTDFWDMHYVENGEVHHHDGHATDFWTDKAIEFVNNNAAGDEPFFLYLSHNMPHVPLGASEQFRGKSDGGFYGDVIEELDWSMGEVRRRYDNRIE